MARANEQQKQQEKQQQKQKLKQQQQQQKLKQQQQQEQKQKQKGKQEQQQNGAGETGALSGDGAKARTKSPLTYITVCSLSLLLTAGPLCVGRGVGCFGEGQGRCA